MSPLTGLRNALIWLVTIVTPAHSAVPSGLDEHKVTLKGQVSGVMEVDPPRLDLEVKDERYTIHLTDETKISKNGRKLKIGDLRKDQKVEILGKRQDRDKPLQLIADEVRILEDSAK